MFVVHLIALAEHDKLHFTGEGGEAYIESGWNPAEEILEATDSDT